MREENIPIPLFSHTADVEKLAPTVTSLEDITSIEDITSLEDLKDDGPISANRVQDFRRTVKAMSTQVTPQTSPKRRLPVFYIIRLGYTVVRPVARYKRLCLLRVDGLIINI